MKRQLLEVDGFEEVRVEADLRGFLFEAVRCGGDQPDVLQLRVQPDAPRDLGAVQVGQDEVDQQDLGLKLVRLRDAPAAAEAAVKEGSQAVIRVRDTGPGIPPDIRPHLFEAFERGQMSVGGADGGLGLGLALVRQIVELHGGSVETADAPGGGTEFVVRLPEGAPEVPDVRRPDTMA